MPAKREMAEAMLDPEYRAASLPTLPLPESSSVTSILALSRDEILDTPKQADRSVEFTLPPKRAKTSSESKAKRVVEGLNISVSQADRVAAISAACASFDHGVVVMHDDEINAGADVALFKNLALLLLKEERKRNQSIAPDEACNNSNNMTIGSGFAEEISQTCEALEMVYRCSPERVLDSFKRLGSEILPLLIQFVDTEINRRQETNNAKERNDTHIKTNHNMSLPDVCLSDTNNAAVPSLVADQITDAEDLTLRKCTKILGHFARVGALTQPLASHPGLLPTLNRVVDCRVGLIPNEARLNSLWVIANLACNAENMVMMVCQNGLLQTLVNCALLPTEEEEEKIDDISHFVNLLRSKSTSVRAILNLSWSPENKVPMSDHPNLVQTLMKTIVYRTSSWEGRGRGVSAMLLQSRRHAAGALRNLAAAPKRNKIHLCALENGLLLERLADVAKFDTDSDVRERALATLHNLACADTATMFVERSNILHTLADMSSADNDAAKMASRAIRILERSITSDMKGYDILRPIVDQVSTAKV